MHCREEFARFLRIHLAAVLPNILLDWGGDLLHNNVGHGGASCTIILINWVCCGFVSASKLNVKFRLHDTQPLCSQFN